MGEVAAGAAATSLDTVGRLVLQGGTHAAGASTTVQLEYVAASIAFVGFVGGVLYWYFGHRVETR